MSSPMPKTNARNAGLGVFALLAAFAIARCSGTSPMNPFLDAGTDSGSGVSDSGASDGGFGDAGATDAGTASDSGTASDGGGTDSGTNDSGQPDSGTGVDAGPPCNLVAQSGCDAGDKCALISNDDVCVPQGTVATGQLCSYNATMGDDCVGGDTCVLVTPTLTTCHEFCATDSDCKQPAVASGSTAEPTNVGHCILQLSGTNDSICTVACNPVTAAGASGCAASLSCFVGVNASLIELTDCEGAGTGTDGTVCTSSADCATGFTCVNNGTASYCRQVCRSGMQSDCGIATDTCYALNASNAMFGVCCSTTTGC